MSWSEIVHDNNFIPALGITLTFVLILLSLMGGLFLSFVRIMRGGAGKNGKERDAVEAREFQEMQRGFTRMEQRIEALETLMIDAHKEKERLEPWQG